MSKSNNGLCYDSRKNKWRYELDGKFSKHFESREEAARGYVEKILIKSPKYKELFAGKTWSEIFKLLGVAV